MSKTEINFLGTIIFKVYKKLQTKLYVKPTGRQRHLHSKSEHPNSTKKGIAYNKALSSTKFATIEAIFISTVNGYLTR